MKKQYIFLIFTILLQGLLFGANYDIKFDPIPQNEVTLHIQDADGDTTVVIPAGTENYSVEVGENAISPETQFLYKNIKNYPNPVQTSTTFNTIEGSINRIYNLNGELVKTIKGNSSFRDDNGVPISSGVFFKTTSVTDPKTGKESIIKRDKLLYLKPSGGPGKISINNIPASTQDISNLIEYQAKLDAEQSVPSGLGLAKITGNNIEELNMYLSQNSSSQRESTFRRAGDENTIPIIETIEGQLSVYHSKVDEMPIVNYKTLKLVEINGQNYGILSKQTYGPEDNATFLQDGKTFIIPVDEYGNQLDQTYEPLFKLGIEKIVSMSEPQEITQEEQRNFVQQTNLTSFGIAGHQDNLPVYLQTDKVSILDPVIASANENLQAKSSKGFPKYNYSIAILSDSSEPFGKIIVYTDLNTNEEITNPETLPIYMVYDPDKTQAPPSSYKIKEDTISSTGVNYSYSNIDPQTNDVTKFNLVIGSSASYEQISRDMDHMLNGFYNKANGEVPSYYSHTFSGAFESTIDDKIVEGLYQEGKGMNGEQIFNNIYFDPTTATITGFDNYLNARDDIIVEVIDPEDPEQMTDIINGK